MQVTMVQLSGPIFHGPAAYKIAHPGVNAHDLMQTEQAASYQVYGHPNVVSLLGEVRDPGTGKLKGVLYEICYCNLKDVLAKKRGTMSSAQVHSILRQLLSATKHINQQGLVHGDIKPENVMVSGTPGLGVFDVKLGDFGLCTRIGAERRGGSPAFMSPECLHDWLDPTKESPANVRDDVYSIGILVLEMISPISIDETLNRKGVTFNAIRDGLIAQRMTQCASLHCEPELLRVVQWCMLPLADRPLACEVLAYLKAHTVFTNDGRVRWHSDTPDPMQVGRIAMNIMVRSRLSVENVLVLLSSLLEL
jgi:Protein kinase domain